MFLNIYTGQSERAGEVWALDDISHGVDLIPVYGHSMDRRLRSENSLELSSLFYLNHFSDKEIYHLLSSQFA
jgi:hypothetical protein